MGVGGQEVGRDVHVINEHALRRLAVGALMEIRQVEVAAAWRSSRKASQRK